MKLAAFVLGNILLVVAYCAYILSLLFLAKAVFNFFEKLFMPKGGKGFPHARRKR